jgi:hypothetical protein
MQVKQSKFSVPEMIAATGLVAGIVLLAPRPVQIIGAGAMALAGIGNLKRHECGEVVSPSPRRFLIDGLKSVRTEVEEVKVITIKRLPQPLQDFIESSQVVKGDQEWLMRELHKYSLLIIGQTNAGKTWFQQQSAILTCEAMERGGTGRIFDLTYGKRGHRWHGLPLGSVVFTDVRRDLPRLLQESVDIRDQRRAEARNGTREKWPAHILHIAELNNSFQEYSDWYDQLDDEERQGVDKPKRLVYLLKQLLTDGHGYQVYLRADAQTLAVGETGINLAMLNQVNFCIRGSSAVDGGELGKVLKDGKFWAEKVAQSRKATGNDHISLAIVEKQPRLFIPPEMNAEISIADSANRSDLDEARLWVNGYRQSIQDAGGPTKAFELLRDSLPSGYRKQSADNPYYVAIKEALEA